MNYDHTKNTLVMSVTRETIGEGDAFEEVFAQVAKDSSFREALKARGVFSLLTIEGPAGPLQSYSVDFSKFLK